MRRPFTMFYFAQRTAPQQKAEFWGYKGTSPDNKVNEPFMKWLTQMANTSDTDVPKVFSTSYGEDEAAWSLEAATRMNTEFQKVI